MPKLEPVAGKLGKLIRLLSSNRDGEVLATVFAIRRTLESEKLDLHALAAVIESANEIKRREPDWHDIACVCSENPSRLRPNEFEFVEDMVRRTVHGGEPTEKQAAWLRAIYCWVRK